MLLLSDCFLVCMLVLLVCTLVLIMGSSLRVMLVLIMGSSLRVIFVSVLLCLDSCKLWSRDGVSSVLNSVMYLFTKLGSIRLGCVLTGDGDRL